ncbi:MAG: 30S ribosomal protein S2 [Actinobacteria bacterium]|nr:30S ribosomal protein S2 [Actinomycetota bacterium]
MAVVTTRQLLEAGMHFGHQTRRWNPKMSRYIYGEKKGIYVIDVKKTLEGIDAAYGFVRDLAARGGVLLFVGTKKQAQGPIAAYAEASGMPYVNERWLGGMLTNFATISTRVRKLQEYEEMDAAGDFEAMPKKEALRHRREFGKFKRNLGGIKTLTRVPDAVFVIDTAKEHIAVTEARKLHLPVIAVVDTNCDPDPVDYVIPGNDDAIRASALVCRIMAEAVAEGRYMAGSGLKVFAGEQAAEGEELLGENGPVQPGDVAGALSDRQVQAHDETSTEDGELIPAGYGLVPQEAGQVPAEDVPADEEEGPVPGGSGGPAGASIEAGADEGSIGDLDSKESD